MRFPVVALALALALAAAASAAPPEVPARLEAKAGKPVLFDVKVPKAGMSWAPGYDKSKCAIVRLHSDDATVASFMALPEEDGEFHLIFWTVGEKAHSRLVLAVGKGKPQPPVPVDPVPVDPVARVEKVVVVVVEETQKRTPAQAAVVSDPALRKWAADKGHSYELVDKDDPAAASYAPYVQKYGVPCVLLFDKSVSDVQVPLDAFKLPAKGSDIRSAVERVTK